jgi:hypothetical protein
VSAARLEQRLAGLLSTPELTVTAGVATAGGAATQAAVSVARVAPRAGLATRRPAELLPRTPQRVSSITVRAVLTVGAAAGATGRADALEATTVLWWRCEDDRVAGGSGFPAGDLTEGYLVLEVQPVGWTTPEAPDPDGAAPVHRIDLDIAALVWPRSVTPQAGGPIGPILVRLGGPPSLAAPVRVLTGTLADIGVDVDLRSLALNPRGPGDPAPLPRELAVAVAPLGDTPAGSVAEDRAALAGGRATVGYAAGPAPGRDELRFGVARDDGPALPIGSVVVEVVT